MAATAVVGNGGLTVDERIAAVVATQISPTSGGSGPASGCFTVTPLLPRPPPPPHSSVGFGGPGVTSTLQQRCRPWGTSNSDTSFRHAGGTGNGGLRSNNIGGSSLATNTLPLPHSITAAGSSTPNRYCPAAPDDGVLGRMSPTCTGMTVPALPLALPLPPTSSTSACSYHPHHHHQTSSYGSSTRGNNERFDYVGAGGSAVSSSSYWADSGNGGLANSMNSRSSGANSGGRPKKPSSYSSSLSTVVDTDVLGSSSTGNRQCCSCCGGGSSSMDAASRAKHQQQQRRCCLRKLKAFFLVGVPMISVVTSSLAWFYASRQVLMTIEYENDMIRRQALQLGKLIVNFNTERELTVIYVTARTIDSQQAAHNDLSTARQRTDQTLVSLITWPAADYPDVSASNMFRSPHLFAAILGGHRDAVRVGVYFWDEVQFYADLIDVILGWLDRDINVRTATSSRSGATGSSGLSFIGGGDRNSGRLNGLLQAYGYLMAAVGYIGAEQALCSAFHSVVCFSHRETFYYANYSFAGESLFRLYRHSYPSEIRSSPGSDSSEADRRAAASSSSSQSSAVAAVKSAVPPPVPVPPSSPPPHPSGWRSADHQNFFPELSTCRRDIMADLDYIGASTDPSLCSPTRKNETRFVELDILTVDEYERLLEDISIELDADEISAERRCTFSAAVAGGVAVYILLAVLMRCLIRAGKRCSTMSGTAATGSDGNGGVVGSSSLSARRRKRKQLQATSSPIPTESSWCPGSTTAEGVDSDMFMRHFTDVDGGFQRVPSSDVVDNNHKQTVSSGSLTNANTFPAMKVACV